MYRHSEYILLNAKQCRTNIHTDRHKYIVNELCVFECGRSIHPSIHPSIESSSTIRVCVYTRTHTHILCFYAVWPMPYVLLIRERNTQIIHEFATNKCISDSVFVAPPSDVVRTTIFVCRNMFSSCLFRSSKSKIVFLSLLSSLFLIIYSVQLSFSPLRFSIVRIYLCVDLNLLCLCAIPVYRSLWIQCSKLCVDRHRNRADDLNLNM